MWASGDTILCSWLGNANNFLREEECVNACMRENTEATEEQERGPKASPSSLSLEDPFRPSPPESGGESSSSGKVVKLPEKCLQGNSPGPCDAEVVRYYFDTLMRKCRPFIFGGCLGNMNNFESKNACIKECEIT